MRALVTGGTGFTGSAIVRWLLREGFSVSCLVRHSSDLRNLAGLDVSILLGDLNDPASLQEAMRGCEHVYHVAALYSSRPEEDPMMFRVNVEGSRNVFQAAAEAGVARIVHTSTIGTIGRGGVGSLPTEDDFLDDAEASSPYVRSKLEAERVALDMAQRGAPLVVVNPCAPVGARDIKPSSTGKRIVDYLTGRTPSFSPGGINFVSVEDVARGHLLAARNGQAGRRYILGNAQGNLQLEDFCAILERVSGVRRPRRGRMWRLGRTVSALRGLLARDERPRPAATGYRPEALTADPTRAIRELGLPQTPLDIAFRQAVDWFRANGYVHA